MSAYGGVDDPALGLVGCEGDFGEGLGTPHPGTLGQDAVHPADLGRQMPGQRGFARRPKPRRTLADGRKVRFFKSNGEVVDA